MNTIKGAKADPLSQSYTVPSLDGKQLNARPLKLCIKHKPPTIAVVYKLEPSSASRTMPAKPSKRHQKKYIHEIFVDSMTKRTDLDSMCDKLLEREAQYLNPQIISKSQVRLMNLSDFFECRCWRCWKRYMRRSLGPLEAKPKLSHRTPRKKTNQHHSLRRIVKGSLLMIRSKTTLMRSQRSKRSPKQSKATTTSLTPPTPRSRPPSLPKNKSKRRRSVKSKTSSRLCMRVTPN